MQWLAALCVRRPGLRVGPHPLAHRRRLFAFGRLGVDRFPNIDIPTISVTTRLPGAAPEQVETEVTDKIEEAVNTISGIDELRSTSSEGVSQVIVDVPAREEHRRRGAGSARPRSTACMPQLPRTVQQPTIEKLDPDAVARAHRGGDRRQAGPRHHRVRRQGAAPPPRERRRRRPGGGGRRPQAARSTSGSTPSGCARRTSRSTTWRARCRRRTPTCPAGAWTRARSRSRCARAAASTPSTSFGDIVVREVGGPPDARARRRPRRGRHGRARTLASVNGVRHGAAADPQAVGHQHRRGRQHRQGAPRPRSSGTCRPATSCASCATSRSSSRPRSTASRSTWSSARSSRRSSCCCSSATCAPR